jgi:hypothetical protein
MLTLSVRTLIDTFMRLADGPMEDGDIIVPKVAAGHLTRHGVPPGDFFREGMQTLFDCHTPASFANAMNFRISPVIREGTGHRVRFWRAIRTLPENWVVRERAEAWMARQLAMTVIRVEDPPEVDRVKRQLYAQLDEHFNGLFDTITIEPDLLPPPEK